MQADLPHTLIKHNDRKGKGGGSSTFVPKANDRAFELQQAANRKAAQRRAAMNGDEAPLSMNDIFSK